MLEETRNRIDGHWARRFGMPVPGLAPVMLGSTGRHEDAALVLLLGDHAYVDVPTDSLERVGELVSGLGPGALLLPGTWEPVAAGPVLGPADHFWADHSTPLADGVPRVGDEQRAGLADQVSEAEWREAGFDREVHDAFGLVEDGRLVAASVVTMLWGWPLDVGVLVLPGARGRGLGRRVAEAALAAAVTASGFGSYRVARSNAPSGALARGLGLTAYGTNLSVPLP